MTVLTFHTSIVPFLTIFVHSTPNLKNRHPPPSGAIFVPLTLSELAHY